MKPIFITLEGPDGAGKTTALSNVLPKLRESRDILATREPGGVRIAEDIREIILNPKNNSLGMDTKTELLLFSAARRVHLLEKIIPALNENKVVIVDRFIDSSVAYQGYAGGLKASEVNWLNRFATDGLKPDLTIYLDIKVEVGLERILNDANREINRLDLAAVEFHKKVVSGYKKLVKREENSQRIKIIDANKSKEEVASEVLAVIYNKFPNEFRENNDNFQERRITKNIEKEIDVEQLSLFGKN